MTHPPGTLSKFPGIVSKREPIGPEGPPSCFDCNHVFRDDEEQFEDTMGNPMCWLCREKLTEKAEALWDEMREESALKREMDGRKQDRKDADRINGRY